MLDVYFYNNFSESEKTKVFNYIDNFFDDLGIKSGWNNIDVSDAIGRTASVDIFFTVYCNDMDQ